MTDKELQRKAEIYATENYEDCIYNEFIGRSNDAQAREQAFMVGAKEMQEQFKQEKKQLKQEKCELLGIIQKKDELIEKMKRCGNCKHHLRDCQNSLICVNNNHKDWELAE